MSAPRPTPVDRPRHIDADASWRRNRLSHIPGGDGLPLFGQTFEYLRNQTGFSRKMVEKYGPVYRTNAFFTRSVGAVSPDVVHLLLRDPDKIYSSELGWDHMIGQFFRRGLMLRDFADHRVHRRIMQAAFTKAALRDYLAMMNPIIATRAEDWGRNKGTFPFYPVAKQLTLDLAGAVFTGLRPGPELVRVNRAFIDMMMATFSLLRVNIPLTKYWRGNRGRAYLERLFYGLIPEKRAGDDSDMLAILCRAKSDEGERLTDDEIVDHMIFLMLAAHDTNTSALTNVMWGLGAHPEWQERLREAVVAIDKPHLDYDDLERLSDVDLVFKETLRLYPPVTAIPRKLLRDVELDGVTVPEGATVWLQPNVTHRLEEYWTKPHEFDPDRFSDDRAEHKQHAGLWYPYSNGAHICLGMVFSVVQAKAVLNQLLRRYRFEIPEGYSPKRQLIPFPKPSDNLPVKLIPLD